MAQPATGDILTWDGAKGYYTPSSVIPSVVAAGLGISVSAAGSGPVTYTVSSNIAYLYNVYVSKSGVDATALPNRPDRSYLTIAAARAAAVALTPSATQRIRIIVLNGTYTNEQIVLYSYIDWDLTSSLIYTTTNTNAITDNNIAVTDCTVYGRANIVSSSISLTGTQLSGVYLQNSSSSVVLYCNNITITSTGTPSLAVGVYSVGTLYLYCNNTTVTYATSFAYGFIVNGGGALQGIVNNVAVTGLFGDGVVADQSGSRMSLIANDITYNNSERAWTVSAQREALVYLKCNNIYHTGSLTNAQNQNAAVNLSQGTPKLYIECNDIIVVPDTNVTTCAIKFGDLNSNANTDGALLSIKCRETVITGVVGSTTNYAMIMEDNTANLPVVMIEGRFKVISASDVNCIQNSTGTLITHKCVLMAAGAGASVANSGLWKDYGATVGNTLATGTAVTVGTPIISALVV